MVKIFVINISDERWERYKDDDRFTRWNGVDGRQLPLEFVEQTYITMHNARESHKRSVAGCSESHLSLLGHIYENKIDDVIILEDDTIIDFDRLSQLKDIKEFCYLGGHFQSPVLKNKFCRENISLKEGINEIDVNHFTIAGGHGYYIPKHQIACDIYQDIMSRDKRRAIDAEFRRLQKNRKKKKLLIKNFVYPAIVELYLPDAINGFTFSKAQYKLTDTKKHY